MIKIEITKMRKPRSTRSTFRESMNKWMPYGMSSKWRRGPASWVQIWIDFSTPGNGSKLILFECIYSVIQNLSDHSFNHDSCRMRIIMHCNLMQLYKYVVWGIVTIQAKRCLFFPRSYTNLKTFDVVESDYSHYLCVVSLYIHVLSAFNCFWFLFDFNVECNIMQYDESQ